MKTCECGCGNEVPYAKKRRKDDQPRFLQGHNLTPPPPLRTYHPKPEETPSGICECGCGQTTAIATYTRTNKRLFKGFPKPLIWGHERKGEKNGRWSGGQMINGKGYRLLYKPGHPMSDRKGYVYEHRFVMADRLGRYLLTSEIVHHKNHNPLDNRIENLEIMTRGEHMRMHNLEAGRVPPSRLGVRKS